MDMRLEMVPCDTLKMFNLPCTEVYQCNSISGKKVRYRVCPTTPNGEAKAPIQVESQYTYKELDYR